MPPSGIPKRCVAYKLPVRLIRRVKDEATRTDRFPAHVVADALDAYLAREARRRRQAV